MKRFFCLHFASSCTSHILHQFSLAYPDSHTNNGRESGHSRILSWCCTVSKSVGNQVCVNRCAIDKEVSQTLKWLVNYRPQKFLGLLAPTQYARVTRLSPSLVPRPTRLTLSHFSCESLATRDYHQLSSRSKYLAVLHHENHLYSIHVARTNVFM